MVYSLRLPGGPRYTSSVDAVKHLLEHGAEVNALDNAGKTPLGVALENKREKELIALLRESGGEE
jgi:ankyrin repeat protein